MTIRNKIVNKVSAFAMTAVMTVGIMAPIGAANVNANAADSKVVSDYANMYSSEGYTLKWNDEFDGTSLNTKDWNVEDHEPGWVNDELQRYVSEKDMDDAIKVSDGTLKLIPSAKKKTDTTEATGTVNPEILKSNKFDSTNWEGGAAGDGKATVEYSDGKAIVDIEESGTENWHIQIQQKGLTLIPGHEYEFSMKAEATKDRSVEISFLDPEAGYDWYGGAKDTIKTTAGEITHKFTVANDKKESSTIALQLNFGKIGDMDDTNVAAKVTMSDVSVKDLSASTSGVDVKKAYDYTSGRINTQNKHDFKYGRFEARAKVPSGNGYLPAFWLMATDETNYGQWPQCGEIDIMEVMGQNIKKSYHTAHYGYDPKEGHSQSQGTYTLEDGSFEDEWHTFRLDWEPGKLTWYVDDVEVYTCNEWHTGKDKESTLTYPAPFDQEFYVILNLAVGGSWVGYPDQAVVDDMANQTFDIDYVRVYQKDEAVYEAAEATAKAPEKKVEYREADSNGNYVLNGDFSKEIGTKDADANNNWILHLEDDAAGSTTAVSGNAIKITPAAKGGVDYSIQLKQQQIPMYRGWEYELSFDACADEARSIIVDLEGPDHGWTRYMKDTKFDLTTDKKTYTATFTMEEATDANGSLEFNLGNQDSLAGVTISNVKLVKKGGELIPEDASKSVRSDGNYVYNGTFDQGEGRLGYWEVADADKANVSVTNKNKVRELKVVVDSTPVTLTQKDLPAVVAGNYELRFDAYMAEGSAADAIKVEVVGEELSPDITTSKANYAKTFDVTKNIDSKDAAITVTFSKPGTYYLDNLFFGESSIIKNGTFNAGLAGFAPYVYSGDLASYVVDSINNPNSFVMTINDTGKEAWYVQLNQDNLTLEKGKTYKVSFKAKSTINRQITYALQQFEGDWTNYSKTYDPVDLTTEWQTFGTTFTMDSDTDTNTRFNITMGSVDGKQITDKHEVLIDDIVLEEVASSDASSDTEEIKVLKPAKNSVKTVAKNAYANQAKLTTIDFSNQTKLTTIKANAFKNCKKLKTIKIYGNKLKKINKTAFKGCPNKKTVKVTIYAKNKTVYNKVVKMIKKAGLKKATFKFKKKK